MIWKSTALCAMLGASISVAISPNTSIGSGFLRGECYARVIDLLANGTLASNDDVFARSAIGKPLSDSQNLTVTLKGCNKLCGPKQRWYQDIGPRLSVWLLPVLLLVSNVELSPLDKRRFGAILHLLGDPIHSIWSLIDKIDFWDRCYRLVEHFEPHCNHRRRVVATVFAGFEEICGPNIVTRWELETLRNRYKIDHHFQSWRTTALELADSRTNEILRTCLAILLFIYQLISGFIKEVGGDNSSPPGGRIATGVFLSWLIPVVLLSNVVGNFPSSYTCFDALSRLAKATDGRLEVPEHTSTCFRMTPSITSHTQSLPWSGGIYTYRSQKQHDRCSSRTWSEALLMVSLAASSLGISFLGGFIILWYLIPNGFNCRHTWMIGVFFAWIASATITVLANSSKFVTGKYHWRFVLIKDSFVAIPSFTMIFLSACGLFNSCKCWSGYLYLRKEARVALNTHAFFEHNGRTIYPLVFGVCLTGQLILFGVIMVRWRHGLRVLRWSKAALSEERVRLMGDHSCTCRPKQ